MSKIKYKSVETHKKIKNIEPISPKFDYDNYK